MDKLNDITHGYVLLEVRKILSAHESAGGQLAAIDAIGLIESGLGSICDFTVGSYRLRRSVQPGLPPETDQRGVCEAPDKRAKERCVFCENCTYCLENAGMSRVEFEEKVLSFFKSILAGGGEDA
jgi:hypothetical protein